MAKSKTARRTAKAKTAKGRARTTRATTRKTAAKRAPKPAAAPTPRTITPYLSVNDAAGAIEWYKKTLGAKETVRQPAPGNKIMHAHLHIGDSDLFLSDIFPGTDMVDPARAGPSTTVHLWTRNADKIWQTATANGAKVTMPIDDMFWGDRYGRFVDPYGHAWSVSWKSKLSKAELDKKREAAMKDFAATAPPG